MQNVAPTCPSVPPLGEGMKHTDTCNNTTIRSTDSLHHLQAERKNCRQQQIKTSQVHIYYAYITGVLKQFRSTVFTT